MHFDLTEEQKALRETLTSMFARQHPPAGILDTAEPPPLDRAVWRDLCTTGITAAMVPEAHGGIGADLLTLTVAAECCGAGVVPYPLISSALAAWLLSQDGVNESAAQWTAPLMSGEAVAVFAGPTDNAPSPVVSSLVERGAEADVIIFLDQAGQLGLVPREAAGLDIQPIDSLDRSRPLVSVSIPSDAIKPLGGGADLAARLFDALLVTLAADALGAATSLHRSAVDYAKERRQYDRPIGSFQGLKHQLADISVELEPARPLCWYAAHAWDTGRGDARRMAAIAKAHLGDIAVASARACIEAFGGIGYTWEHPAHLFLKRAMFDRTALGTPTTHRERAATLAGWSAPVTE